MPPRLFENKLVSMGLGLVAFIGILFITALINCTPVAAQVAPVNPPDQALVGSTTTTTVLSGLPPTTVGASPVGPRGPAGPEGANAGNASISLNLGEALNKPSQSVTIIILLTLISISPSLLILLTAFTRIAVVIALARNAIGIPSVPPNQVLIGIAIFLTFFVMAPTFKQMNDQGIAPMMAGQISQTEGIKRAVGPLKQYMLKQTREDELAMFVDLSGEKPETREDVALTSLIPAYIISELKTAFIIGFAIYIPFLVIDIIIASSLMSMGMMMLPPQMISLPFKLMLFVLVDGWALLARSLLTSFN